MIACCHATVDRERVPGTCIRHNPFGDGDKQKFDSLGSPAWMRAICSRVGGTICALAAQLGWQLPTHSPFAQPQLFARNESSQKTNTVTDDNQTCGHRRSLEEVISIQIGGYLAKEKLMIWSVRRRPATMQSHRVPHQIRGPFSLFRAVLLRPPRVGPRPGVQRCKVKVTFLLNSG